MGLTSSKVYNICKNVFAKWCFPNKNPDKVTQEEINIFLDNLDYKNKFVKASLPDKNKMYNIPQDYYLRGLYRLVEYKQNTIGTTIDNFFLNEVLTKLYGSTEPVCVNHMFMYINKKTNQIHKYIFDNIETNYNYNDARKQDLINAILKIYSKCRYGAILLNSHLHGNNIGHRTVIFFEYINNILNVYYYDPHGTQGKSWSSEHNIYDFLSIFFNDMKISMNNYGITNIILKRYDIMCPIGVQSYSAQYDIGMCQIFSSLWLYLVIKIIDTAAKEQNISLPETDKWIFFINKYFTTNFNPKQMYNSLLLFISKKYTLFTQTQEKNKEYKKELEKYIEFLFDTDGISLSKFETSFFPKSEEEKKERDYYLESVEEKGYIMSDISGNCNISERIIKNHVINIINKLNIDSDYKYLATLDIKYLVKLNDDVRKLAAVTQFQKGVQYEENDYNILLAIKVIELTKLSERNKKEIIKALKEELNKISSKKRKVEETYEEYAERLKKQQKGERYSIRQLIPSFRKKNLYEECNTNEDCLSNFCYHNEITGERNCLIK